MQHRAIWRPNAAAEHRANFGDDRQSRATAAIVAFPTRDETAAPGGLRKAVRSAAAEPLPLHASVPEGITAASLIRPTGYGLRS